MRRRLRRGYAPWDTYRAGIGAQYEYMKGFMKLVESIKANVFRIDVL